MALKRRRIVTRVIVSPNTTKALREQPEGQKQETRKEKAVRGILDRGLLVGWEGRLELREDNWEHTSCPVCGEEVLIGPGSGTNPTCSDCEEALEEILNSDPEEEYSERLYCWICWYWVYYLGAAQWHTVTGFLMDSVDKVSNLF